METKDINNNQEDKCKKLLSNTKIEAGENLKFRIMQQIETEKTLSPKKATSSIPLLRNMLSIFGIMYGLIGMVLLGVYGLYGKVGLESSSVLLSIIAIASVCSIFGMISVFDDKRRSRHKK